MLNENAMLRSKLQKAGIDRIHRENQNIYDTSVAAMTERHNHYHRYRKFIKCYLFLAYQHAPAFYGNYWEPPVQKTERVVVKKNK